MAELVVESQNAVVLSGHCHEADLLRFRGELESLIRSCDSNSFTIRLKDLESVSSALLSVLLCCTRAAEQVGCELSLRGMPQKLYDMARVGGIESILPIQEN